MLPYAVAMGLPLAALTWSPGRLTVGDAVHPNCAGTAGVPSGVTMFCRLASVTVPKATDWLPPEEAAWIDTGWLFAFGARYGVLTPSVASVTDSSM